MKTTVFISRAQYIAIPPNDQCSEDELPCNGRIINGHARTAVPEQQTIGWLDYIFPTINTMDLLFASKSPQPLRIRKACNRSVKVAINKI